MYCNLWAIKSTVLPKQNAPIRFTFLWVEDNRWEGKDYKVEIQSKTLVAAGD